MSKKYNVQFDEDIRFNVKFTEGIRGASAYEVALQNGFSGTEEEWLASLKAETDKEEIAKLAGAAIKDYLAENPISQTQADWNQTDETAVEYVKNRTHYTEVVLGASTTYIARYYTGNDTMGDKNMSTALVYAFDNVKLTFENEAVLQSNVLTGETRTLVFAIGAGTLTIVATANNGIVKITNNTGISQRAVWEYPSSVEVIVHQIDEKFIPETIARTADVVATPPAATVGQTIIVSAVDDTGKPTAWEAVDMAESVEIPETLPNPNSLVFTGAVSAEYDGSRPVTVEIPEGGGGASGGGSEWEVILDKEISVTAVTIIEQSLDKAGFNEYVATIQFSKDTDENVTVSGHFTVHIDGNRVTYFTTNGDFDKYSPTLVAKIYPVIFWKINHVAQLVCETKMADVSYWPHTGPDASSGNTYKMICSGSGSEPSGIVRINMPAAYTGTIRIAVLARN